MPTVPEDGEKKLGRLSIQKSLVPNSILYPLVCLPVGPRWPGLSGKTFLPKVSLKVLETSGMCLLWTSKWPSPVIHGCFNASDALYLYRTVEGNDLLNKQRCQRPKRMETQYMYDHKVCIWWMEWLISWFISTHPKPKIKWNCAVTSSWHPVLVYDISNLEPRH